MLHTLHRPLGNTGLRVSPLGLGEQGAGGGVIRDGEASGVFHALITAQFDRAQAQR